jgi:hypothetical protein
MEASRAVIGISASAYGRKLVSRADFRAEPRAPPFIIGTKPRIY